MADDRKFLIEREYKDATNLEARRSIYAYADPPVPFHELILDALEGRPAVLDVGCGNGVVLAKAAERFGAAVRLAGLDLSAGMIREAQAAAPQAVCAVGDVQTLPFGDDAFDAVLAIHMLYHVPDIQLAVGEMRRVLRPDGVVVAATNAPDHLAELTDVFRQAAQRLGRIEYEDPATREIRTFAGENFAGENGAGILRQSFDSVQRHDLIGRLVVPDVEPLASYLNSMRGAWEAALPRGIQWSDCMAAAREALERMVPLRITTHPVVFVGSASSRPA